MSVLVTGGAGYIGSHACVELLSAGYEVVVVDNLVNSRATALQRVEQITGKPVAFYQADIRDGDALARIFEGHDIDAVMHFAGLKAVAESVENPARYYANNVGGSITLFDAMAAAGVFRLIFSSSATVYGEPDSLPIREDAPLRPVNPYGRSKQMIEEMIRDLAAADERWRAIILRYFNPVGAHSSGLIGEDPVRAPANLMSCALQVAIGVREFLSVYGGDYDTPDGTGIRDYIHVVDLVRGHLRALDRLSDHCVATAYNLGSERGYSVLEVLSEFERVCGTSVPHRIVGRRPGDVAICYADTRTAMQHLDWSADLGLANMVGDAWRWQLGNSSASGDTPGSKEGKG